MTSQGQADSFRATCNFEYSSFFPGCFCGPGQKCQAKVPEKLHSPSGAQKTQLKCKKNISAQILQFLIHFFPLLILHCCLGVLKLLITKAGSSGR